ncbi:MAG TPA: ribonuclease domain-containing protein [Ornithinibacter sp.]|nr:ribonuclease domain-containing protein [Ornithinibacter sp.]
MPSASSRRRVPAWVVVALVVGAVVLWAFVRNGSGEVFDPAVVPSQAATTAGASGTAGPTPSGGATPDSGLPTVAESALPDEADTTLALIRAGGPFPYEEDGGVFGNRERILPRQRSGYYREYTVETPGEGDRGPRRIIGGAGGDLYWTTDHYASFRQVQEGR